MDERVAFGREQGRGDRARADGGRGRQGAEEDGGRLAEGRDGDDDGGEGRAPLGQGPKARQIGAFSGRVAAGRGAPAGRSGCRASAPARARRRVRAARARRAATDPCACPRDCSATRPSARRADAARRRPRGRCAARGPRRARQTPRRAAPFHLATAPSGAGWARATPAPPPRARASSPRCAEGRSRWCYRGWRWEPA